MIVADSGYITEYDYPVTVQCIVREAIKQQLEPEMVWAILRQENGRVNKHSVNTNKTLDIGPMQINNGKMEKYLRDLQSKTNMSYSQFRHRLYSDACFNVSVGAYVLRVKINAAGGSKFKGMGWYNSANEPHYSRYLAKVKGHYFDIKNSAKDQAAIEKAKQDLYANEYKIAPIEMETAKKKKKKPVDLIAKNNTKSNKSKVNYSNFASWQTDGSYYKLPATIRIPKTQIVYNR